jgi:hypothetical protein
MPTANIFSERTIFDHYAFHLGGRKEIQFNIGFEENNFRFGLAFSLERSQDLNDISLLFPNIYRLNLLINEKPQLFDSYEIWYYNNGVRSENYKVHEIPENWIGEGNFIFFGKLINKENINIKDILLTFNDMLEIYFIVENYIVKNTGKKTKEENNFVFEPKEVKLVGKRKYSTVARNTSVHVRHSIIQETLYNILVKKYGKNNVGLENEINGGKIDIVVKENGNYIFYEIKTGTTAESCIRQALGQLFEYAYYPGRKNAEKIIIVGEYQSNNETNQYIKYLQTMFNIPLEYMHVSIE